MFAVPFSDYPGHDEQGFVSALCVCQPLGGHVVLYDQKAGAFPTLDMAKGRWIVIYRPGRKYVQFVRRSEAREAMTALAELRDDYGILPKFQKSPLKPRAIITPPSENPPARAPDAAAAPANDATPLAETASTKAPETKDSAPTPPQNFHLDFKRLMQEEFTPEVIVRNLKEMLEAKRTTVTRTGEVHTSPDYTVRERGLRLVVEFAEGKATERPDVKEVKKVSWKELQTMCTRSPAARKALRKMLEDAEKAPPQEEVTQS